jgi:hypothetical protein
MKQSEKLDIILRYLYERRDDGREYNIAGILAESNVETTKRRYQDWPLSLEMQSTLH